MIKDKQLKNERFEYFVGDQFPEIATNDDIDIYFRERHLDVLIDTMKPSGNEKYRKQVEKHMIKEQKEREKKAKQSKRPMGRFECEEEEEETPREDETIKSKSIGEWETVLMGQAWILTHPSDNSDPKEGKCVHI